MTTEREGGMDWDVQVDLERRLAEGHPNAAQMLAEQRPDVTAPCPHCGRPVNEDVRNIGVERYMPRLLARCGGSGYAYTGLGCFERVAWDPDAGAWTPY